MSKRAEEKALEAYPITGKWIGNQYGEWDPDINRTLRAAHQQGYEQAEKDLADVAAFSSGPDGFYYGKGYQQGKKDAENHLGWHSVDESLPPVDEEVIVLRDELNGYLLPDASFVGVGHIVNPELTVEVGDISYMPISDSSWNIDGVKYWMPMPKIPNEDE